MEYTVSQRQFKLWRLEYWWIAFRAKEFHPEGRLHLKGGWFWKILNEETVSKDDRTKRNGV